MPNLNEISISALSFIGDAVYSLMIRTRLLEETNRKASALHKMTLEYVNADAQAAAYTQIKPFLTEDEQNIFKRGRNSQVVNNTKKSTLPAYKTATGLEALFGYLYLINQNERLEELLDMILSQTK